MTERHAEPEICDHLRVPSGDTVLIRCHDVPSDPLYAGAELRERQVDLPAAILRCDAELNSSG